MNKLLLVLSFTTIILSSCTYNCNNGRGKKGNGNIVSQEVSVNSFSDLSISGAYQVYLKNDSTYSVRIMADENLIDRVLVKEENGELVIKTQMGLNLRPSRRIKIHISSPEFNRVKVSGAVDIFGEGKISGTNELSIKSSGATHVKLDLDVPKVRVDISGAGEVNLTGETRDFDIQSSGASEVNCFDLKAENIKLKISGAGDAKVFSSVSLDVVIRGAGSVKYKGNARVTQKISGAGSLKKVS